MPRQRHPGQRAGLSRTAVLTAARDLLAEGGLAALTMRNLARHLGVAPNALYSHVGSKDRLIDDLLDDVLAALRSPEEDTADPVAGLRDLMTSTYDLLLAHPDLVPLYLARQGARGPHARRLGTIMDALLTRAGLAGDTVDDARRVLIVYAISFAAFTTGSPGDATPPRDSYRRGLDWMLSGMLGPAGERPARAPGSATGSS